MARLPLSAPLFSRRAKGKTRFVFRAALLALVVVVGTALLALGITDESTAEYRIQSSRRLNDDDDETDCGEKADPPALIVLYLLGMLYMFLALAVVVDEFFVPSLEHIADHMELTPDVAGATLMAAGGSAPELFTSFIGTFQRSDVGFGTIVGSAVFNVLFVIGMCAIFSREILSLTWWPLARDCFYYAISLAMLSTFFGGVSPDIIEWWEAVILLSMYGGYVLFMWKNQEIYRWIVRTFKIPEDPGVADENASFVKPSTFRAGILRLLHSNGDMFETAGVAIVSQIAGDVKETFTQLDANGDGHIDAKELEQLLRKLGSNPTADDIQHILSEIDQDQDSKIDFNEFSVWYIGSEQRLQNQVDAAFNEMDTNKSGSIDREKLRNLLERLGDKPSPGDIKDAMNDLDRNGDGQITFEEFKEWYNGSLFWTQKQKEAHEAAETAEGLDPFDYPVDAGLRGKLFYFFTFPLMFSFWLTMPDVRRPQRQGMWAYATFFLSIMWVGIFSFFMVSWATVVGATIGIPPVVMGLTVLAAGTSVPDLLSSVIVARQGEGDMAVSSSIGSNIFDVLIGLPLPWLSFNIIMFENVSVGADNLFISVIVLLAMLVSVIVTIVMNHWRMTHSLGYAMFILYAVFLAQDLARVTDYGC